MFQMKCVLHCMHSSRNWLPYWLPGLFETWAKIRVIVNLEAWLWSRGHNWEHHFLLRKMYWKNVYYLIGVLWYDSLPQQKKFRDDIGIRHQCNTHVDYQHRGNQEHQECHDQLEQHHRCMQDFAQFHCRCHCCNPLLQNEFWPSMVYSIFSVSARTDFTVVTLATIRSAT